MRFASTALALALALGLATVQAQEPNAGEAEARAFLSSLHYEEGSIALPDASAHIDVKPGFRFLGHDDARRVLEEYWGNPPDDSVLGMLVPDNAGLDSEHSWAVVVTYSDEGYVSDEDANEIDYDALLKDMKSGTSDSNEERKRAGYPAIELVGWAQPPRYDAGSKRLHWAKELAFEGEKAHTLNYDIRVLGRSGFISLNAVASMGDIGLVNSGMAEVLPMAEFDAGQRYADFKPGSDKVAAYGLAALVGGGIAAKTGLLAKLGALLLAGKKFIVLIFIGLAAFARKFFGGKKDKGSVQ